MSTLPANASRAEIEEELNFLEVSIDTIDVDAEDAEETRRELEVQMQDIQMRIQAMDGSSREGRMRTPEMQESTSFDMPSRERQRQPYSNGHLAAAREVSPISRPPSSNKRSRDDAGWSFSGLVATGDEQRKVRKTSEGSNATSHTHTTDDLEILDREASKKFGSTLVTNTEKAVKRMQQQRDRAAALKQEQEDMALAMKLSQEGMTPSASSSSSSQFARPAGPSRQSYFDGNGQVKKPVKRSPSPPAFKPDPYAASSSRAVPPQRIRPIKNESDSDLEEITPNQFAAASTMLSPTSRARRELNQQRVPAPYAMTNAALSARFNALARPPVTGSASTPGIPVNPMAGGSSVYGPPATDPYSVNSLPQYGNGLTRPAPAFPFPATRMPGMWPGTELEELANLTQPGPRMGDYGTPPMGDYDPFAPYGGYHGGGYTAGGGGMSDEEIEEMMKAVQADKHFPIDKRAQTPRGFNVELYEHQKIGLTWLMLQEDNKSCKGGILADDMGLGKTIQALALMVAKPSDDPARKTTLIVAPVALMKQWEKEIASKMKINRRLSVYVYHGGNKKASFAKLSEYDVVLTTFGTLAAEFTRWVKMEQRMAADHNPRRLASEKFSLIDDNCKWYRIIIDEAQCIKNKLTKAAQAAHKLKAQFRLCMSGTPMMNNIGELHALIYFLRIPPYNDPEKFRRDIKGPLTSTSSYGNGKEKAMQAVQALLKVIMLRRTKKSEVDGKPIIEGLPDRTTEVAAATFDEHQAQFYHALETETQLRVNAYLQAGKVGKNYSYILVRLLRLRQACCHPHLIRDFAEDGAAPVDMSTDVMEELARQFEDKVVVRLKEADGAFECPICYDATPSPTLIFSCGHGVCGDCLTRLVDPSNLLADGNDGGSPTSRCPECRGVLDPKRVVSWKVFKSIHMPEELEAEAELAGAAEEPVEAGSDSDSDSSDEDSDIGEDDADEHGDLRDFVVDDDEEVVADDNNDEIDTKIKGDDEDTASEGDEVAPRNRKSRSKHRVLEDDEDTASEAEEVDDADAEDDFAPVRDKGKKTVSKGKATPKSKAVVKGKSKASVNGKGKGKARASSSRRKGKGNKKEKKSLADLKKNSLKNAKEKKKYLKRLKKTWMPSAKTNRTMELLREIREQQNGERTIIFSQFTTFLDLLEVAIGDEFKYRRYDGSMRAAERNVAVEEFQDPTSGLEVLLVSLKAGNAGLNLTAANHVIILDPFWNPFVEEQAIDRAHRIGQTRPVKVHRVLVPDTVEDRIIALQEKKRDLINAALDEKAGETLGRLGVAELRYLFGFSSSLPGGADRAGVIGDGVPGRAAYLGSAAADM